MTTKEPKRSRQRRERAGSSGMPIEEAIIQTPQPLISMEHKLVALWTPKVGCTSFVKWFFKSPESSFGPRNMPVHKFRQFVYYPSDEYQAALADYLESPTDYEHIKLIRHPYKRAVSSYLQFLKMEENNERAFKQFLGVDEMPTGFEMSFARFVELLSNLNIAKCNQHWKRQFHPIEEHLELRFRYAELSETATFLKQVENDLDLPRTNRGYLEGQRNQRHHTKRAKTVSGFVGDKPFNAESIKSPPGFENFYSDELLESVRNIYRKDFRYYRFETDFDLVQANKPRAETRHSMKIDVNTEG